MSLTDNPDNHEDRLDELLADFLQRQEAGEDLDAAQLIRTHPEFADDIRAFFTDEQKLEGLAGPIAMPAMTRRPVLGNIRYFGDYELLEEIARGGMGIVYKARQKSLNRIVAVKMILSGRLASDADAQRFQTEAEAAANLKHPNIVSVHEVGVHDGQHYFSMDFVEGKNLAEIVRDGPLPAETAARYVRQVAVAIEYAHQQGTLHRDLKPSNVLIDVEDNVQITDFGLALRVEGDSELTRTGQILGTPSYMPPEQAQNNRSLIGPASDVYSLGALLYELLTGKPPFRSASPAETMRQVIEEDPLVPRLHNPGVPADLATICLKCLRKEPHKRYLTANELAEDLRRYSSDEPIQARPVSWVEKTWRWCRRHSAVTGSATVILLAISLISMYFLVDRRKHQRARVAAEVASVAKAYGPLVPGAIDSLGRLPREMVLAELEEQFKAAEEIERLHLAYALSRFGDVRVEFLVSQVEQVSAVEFGNLVSALGMARAEAVSFVERMAQSADDQQQWRHKARLAMLSLHLQDPTLARDMCRLRPDPTQRTWFIEECSNWHSDLSTLADHATDYADVPLRTAIALAAASAVGAEVTSKEAQAWGTLLKDWYRQEPDKLTHSVADWALRRWGFDVPVVSPLEDADWQTNSIGMTMVSIPAGTFVRQDIESAIGAVQAVMLERPFSLSVREVSLGHFQEFLDDDTYPDADKPVDWDHALWSPTAKHPVQAANWYDAVLFCNWLSKKEGLSPCYERTGETEQIDGGEYDAWRLRENAEGYRLPTEAEWEYASRAGTVTLYSHGSDETLLDRYAVHGVNAAEITGSRKPNDWGLFDMHGNVNEWCHDRHGRYGLHAFLCSPTGPLSGESRILRGGRYSSNPHSTCRHHRTYNYPTTRFRGKGFRILRSEKSPSIPRDNSLFVESLIRYQSLRAECHPSAVWRCQYEIAALQHFIGDIQGYRETCQRLLVRLIESEDTKGRHEVLMAHLFFPTDNLTDVLQHAKEHAASGGRVNQRMLGLAHYRIGDNDVALLHLQESIAARLTPISRLVSLLCLALVQLRMERLEQAIITIAEARSLHDDLLDELEYADRQPWGVIPSLWREVQAALTEAGIDEPVPELPPLYNEFPAEEVPSNTGHAGDR